MGKLQCFPNSLGKVWRFKTKRFTIFLELERERKYKYEGDDPDGETQARIDNGEFVAFSATVQIYLDDSDNEIASNSLYGCIYDAGRVYEFVTDHWNSPPEYRNTLAMKAQNKVICHYFPDMVREAVAEARSYIRGMNDLPYIRESAA